MDHQQRDRLNVLKQEFALSSDLRAFPGTELALFAIPISVIQYMPNFFFGSLLMLFGIEIIADWLIFSYRKV